MNKPPSVTFRHMKTSAALEERVREHVEHLHRFHDHIMGCEVVIVAPTGHHQNGAPFEVRIDLTLPDGSLHVNGEDGEKAAAHADAYIAVRDAFDALERMLKKRADTRHRRRDRSSIRKPAETGEPA